MTIPCIYSSLPTVGSYSKRLLCVFVLDLSKFVASRTLLLASDSAPAWQNFLYRFEMMNDGLLQTLTLCRENGLIMQRTPSPNCLLECNNMWGIWSRLCKSWAYGIAWFLFRHNKQGLVYITLCKDEHPAVTVCMIVKWNVHFWIAGSSRLHFVTLSFVILPCE